MTVADAARSLGISDEAVRQKAKRRTLRSMKGNDGRLRILIDTSPPWRRELTRLQQFGGSKTVTPLISLESAFQGRHYTGCPGSGEGNGVRGDFRRRLGR
jgi:hypothetical protein